MLKIRPKLALVESALERNIKYFQTIIYIFKNRLNFLMLFSVASIFLFIVNWK